MMAEPNKRILKNCERFVERMELQYDTDLCIWICNPTNIRNGIHLACKKQKMSTTEQYLGNPNLKKANVATNFTPEEVQEYIKCSEDPVYFIQTYIKIVSLDKGLIPFDMYDFQVDMTRKFHDNRFNIAKLPRQSGKSTIVTSYLLWLSLIHI